ncbi:phospholipase B1, membrane-associated-like isoform X3 [Halichondria panicea]
MYKLVASSLLLLTAAFAVQHCSCQTVHFDCPKLPPLPPARTVHELRPQDIRVVMALGDSVTAGFGMMGRHGNIIEDLQEYRGMSWSIGMDDDAQTVPNFLKNYRDDLIGGSLGHHLGELCYDIVCPPFQYKPDKDVLNAAQSGAMIPNLVTHEWRYMLEQLKEHKEIDMDNDWKVLTLFIGANDLCLACSEIVPTLTPDDFEKHLRETLDEVMKIPRVFVNLVLTGNISGIYTLSLKNKHCTEVHRLLPIECACAFLGGSTPEGVKLREDLDKTAMAFNDRMNKVAADYVGIKDDFAVVIQPFFSGTDPSNFTIDFLSDLDCFHPSLLAHQHMAKGLWNNMLTPAAQKKTSLVWTDPFVCPTNNTLLYTN